MVIRRLTNNGRKVRVRDSVQCEVGWRCLRVAGNFDFSFVGVIASLTGAMATQAGVKGIEVHSVKGI